MHLNTENKTTKWVVMVVSFTNVAQKLYYKGSPLRNALVKTWHKMKNKTEKKDLKTNSKGEIVFPVNTHGKWMISTVKMERLLVNPICDWQSYWGSLTWGYK